jgi:hypothetical protein
MAQEMLAGVKTQEDDQAGQAPLQKLKAPSQWAGNSCLLTLWVQNHLNTHLIQCRWFYRGSQNINNSVFG